MKKPQLRIGSVVIDCVNFEEMVAFWKEALHYATRGPLGNDFVIIRDPSGRNTNVSFNKVKPSERLTGRNWLHFDLYATDQASEVDRLLKLGAVRHPQSYEPADDFVVLEDPDGNMFCVVDATRKVVDMRKVAALVKDGWVEKARLPDGRVIVGKASETKVKSSP